MHYLNDVQDLGGGGAKQMFVEVLVMECKGVAQMKRKPHHVGWGPGHALGPWKLLSFKCLNMDFPCF